MAAFEAAAPATAPRFDPRWKDRAEAELVFGLLGGEFWRGVTGRMLVRRAWRGGLPAAAALVRMRSAVLERG